MKEAMTLEKIVRVMIVDDSSVYRNILRSVLQEDPEIEVVAQAINGRLALPRVNYYHPEIIILDNEMPEMTGLETLEVLRRDNPDVGVIMFSSHTVEGARVTIRALELGALDFVTKPGMGSGDPREYIKSRLITMIKSIVKQRRLERHRTPPTKIPARVRPDIKSEVIRGQHTVCAIGISTGGPAALRELFPLIKEALRGPIFVVQHMPPIFTRQLADSLNQISELSIVEAEDRQRPMAGTVYIAPGGKHMIVENAEDPIIRILDTPAENNCRPSVNVLFRSIASVYGSKAIGVIMTGMGTDGYEGFKAMNAKGAYLIGQNEISSLIYGMPAQPTRDGLVRESLDIGGIAGRIQALLT